MHKLYILTIVILIIILLSSVALSYNHFSKQDIELTYQCGNNQKSIVLTEPDGIIDDNDLWELEDYCNLTISNIKNKQGKSLVKVEHTNLFKFEVTQYYCKDRDIYYECEGFSKYYQLEQGKCLNPEGNKLCKTGWILI